MNNYQFYNYDWYSNRGQNNYFVPTRNSQDNLFDPKDGFEKGNMFMSLYNQYKNYQPANLNPKNEQEKLLFNIQSISFAAHDINLYLDTHPNNQSLLMLYKDYIQKKEELMREYEKKYGPLTTMSKEIGNNQFNWIKSPWPWEEYNV